jgi:5'-3' exonuclease
MLLDTASLYYRAFYGVPDRRASPGAPPNNAVRGLLDMVATLLTTYRPTHLAACWDNDWRPAFRVEAIPTYKAHRAVEGRPDVEDTPEALVPQVPVIVEVLAALGLPRLGADGYEADDVIGTLTAREVAKPEGERDRVDVVTGDRDLFQLVDDEASVRVLYTARGGVRDPDVVTQSFLRNKYDIDTGPAYADMATLRGDTSDGLPGVAGIGEKTAAALINRYGGLAALRAALAEGDPHLKGARRARLEEASDYLDVAPKVVAVATDCPIEETDLSLPEAVAHPDLLLDLVDSHDLRSPVNRVLAALQVAID